MSSTCSADISKRFETGRQSLRPSWLLTNRWEWQPFLTSFTTALGFLTLLSSGIQPVRELGIYAAAGVFIAFFLSFSLLPAILVLTKVPKLAYKEPSDLFWNKLVRIIFFFSMRNQWKILGATLVVIVVSLWSISRIEVNNYLLEDVGKDDPMRYSFEYFERYFAGARPFELAVSVKGQYAGCL